MKKILSLVLALCLVALCIGAAVADKTSQHTITIKNTDQYVAHTYEAYQVFLGKLDPATQKLSDIEWGSGVKGADLLAALKADTTYGSKFTDCDSAAKVAEVLGKDPFTNNSAAIDAIARIISSHLTTTKADFTRNEKTYTATVTGDGYYFVKDTTTTLTSNEGSDTLSKYLLNVVGEVSVNAKDTHMKPDKEILKANGQDFTRVKEDSAAVGDVVTFEVKIKVPDTTQYQRGFYFDMQDKLPVGMTFMGITSVQVGDDTVPYTMTVAEYNPTTDTYGDFGAYTAPTSAAAAVTKAGGQKIKLVFDNFKAFAEAEGKNRIGKNLVVTYTAVVNKDADFTSTGNENEVWFDYANDPNSEYDGTNPDGPVGETPHDKTKHKLINIEILKTGDNGAVSALAGAEFTITSSEYTVTLMTGEKFVVDGYTLQSGEDFVGTDDWYLLKDGSYTKTAPTSETTSYYQNENKYKKVSFSNSVTTPAGDPKTVTVVTGEDGKIVLKGLKPGTYSIKETKAPSGYNLDPNTYTIKINWNTTTLKFEKDSSSSAGVTWTDNTATASVTIDDKSGTTLPSTGGIGTTIFYILGGLLIVGAAIILVARRKAHE